MSLVAAAVVACAHPTPTVAPVAAPKRVTLAVLPAESDSFPNAARTATQSMTSAHVIGIDATQVSKVSLEIVQLSIECVDTSPTCYAAVGRSLAANRLLFAQIGEGTKRGEVKVAITLFDVDANSAKGGAEQVFANENQATAAIAALVAKVTQQ